MEALVRRYYPPVFRYVMSFVKNEDDSYDVTQEVFLSVIRNISSFVPWRTVKGWIYTVAYSKCMDHFRREKRESFDELTEEIRDLGESFEDVVENSMVLHEVLARLSPTQRETVRLYYVEGYTAPQIAAMTGTPLPTVKSRLSAAKGKIRELSEDMYDG